MLDANAMNSFGALKAVRSASAHDVLSALMSKITLSAASSWQSEDTVMYLDSFACSMAVENRHTSRKRP
jgi:hypothetical protein